MKPIIDWKYLFLGIIIGIVIALVLGITKSEAHPPCDKQQPQCGYVQVVNPITGLLEQQYVCE